MSESLVVNIGLIGLIFTAITIIIALLSFLKRHLIKSLSYRIINMSALLSVKEEARDKIKISYAGKEVENVTLLLLEFVNTGNVPIIPTDIIKPICITFDKEAKVLTSEVENGRRNLGIVMTTNEDSVTIKPELINPKDSFIIKILLSKAINGFNISDYRIVGIEEIKEIVPRLNAENIPLILVLSSIASFIGGAYGYASTQNDIFLALFIIGIVIFSVSFGVMTISILSAIWQKYVKKEKISRKKNEIRN